MSQSFSAFELVQTALHLNPQLVIDDRLEALEEAFELLSFAEDHRRELGKNRFLHRTDKRIGAIVKIELDRAVRGERTENTVQIGPLGRDGSECLFYRLLREEKVHPDLPKMSQKSHFKYLKHHRIAVHLVKLTAKDDPYAPVATVWKMDAIKYARLESKRRWDLDAKARRKSRARCAR
jgi:hypothetical protein